MNHNRGWREANEFTEQPINYVHALMFVLFFFGGIGVLAFFLPLWMG